MSEEFISPFDRSDRLDPAINANPYPSYHELRAQDPVHWSEEHQCCFLTRYADFLEALRDRRLSSDRISAYASQIPEPMGFDVASADHTGADNR